MHPSSYTTMEIELNKLDLPAGASVLDVGSLDVNGTYRPLVEAKNWQYVGVDVREGPNVDLVVTPATLSTAGVFDAVISGSTMEHVFDLREWVDELSRLLKPAACLLIYTHHRWREHRYPVDCWRILPDGMRWLFDQTGCLTNYHIRMVDENDIFGRATKTVTSRRESQTGNTR